MLAQIGVNFNVGYYDEYGNVIDQLRSVRKRYVRRWDGLLLDVVSIFPVEVLMLFFKHAYLYKSLLIHLVRFIHVKRYFKSLQSRISVKYDHRLPRYCRLIFDKTVWKHGMG